MTQQQAVAYFRNLANPKIAVQAQKFFKIGIGEYGYGDKFLGLRVPQLRKATKLFQDSKLSEIKQLLRSEYHEIRLFSLLLLVRQFSNAEPAVREKIYRLYLKNTKYVNNWDLVDSSAPYIVGVYLFDKDRSKLYELVASKLLWARRIAIIATFYFIKNDQFKDTLRLSRILLNDPEPLIHKAVGWMLREIGNRDLKVEEKFLNRYHQQMPRVMLRYAIEKFSNQHRQAYLNGTPGTKTLARHAK